MVGCGPFAFSASARDLNPDRGIRRSECVERRWDMRSMGPQDLPGSGNQSPTARGLA